MATKQQVFEKRTWDQRTIVVNCTDFLDTSETIASIASVAADQGGITFGTPVVNATPVTFPDGSTAAIGKAVQVRVLNGAIPAGQLTLNCTTRLHLVTTIDPQLEATFIVRLNDQAYPT